MLFIYFKDKALFEQAFTELVKGLDKASVRFIKYLTDLFYDMIIKGFLSHNNIKTVFEKALQISLDTYSKNSDKTKLINKFIQMIYEIIQDDHNKIKQYIHIASIKDYDLLFSKVFKSCNIMFTLYPQVTCNNENNQTNSKEKEVNNASMPMNGVDIDNKDMNDLCLLLPKAFFEYNLLTVYNEKMSLLEEANSILSRIKEVLDKDKNYIEIYKIINYSIEDSNILIHLEGIKLFGQIARLLKSKINIQKAKTILEQCFDKFKDKKSIVKNELYIVFDTLIENDCMNIDVFITFCLSFSRNPQKAVTIVKQGIFEYLKGLIKNSSNLNKQLIQQLNENSYLHYIKMLIDIIPLEPQNNIKDLCTALLIFFKSRIESNEGNTQLDSLIKKLPNHRRMLLLNYSNRGNTHKNYKTNIRKVKSTIALSSLKSDSKDKKQRLEFNRQDCQSASKNDKVKSQLSILKTEKMKDNNKHAKQTNINIIKNKTISSVKDNKDNRNQEPTQSIKNNKVNNEKSKTKQQIFEKQKKNVTKHIYSLAEKSLDDYSKVIVRDFLCFANNVINNQLQESLSFHFKVMIDILNTILHRMQCLKSNNTTENNNQIHIKNIINRILKIIIITPCIIQLEDTPELDQEMIFIILRTIKQITADKEAHLLYLIDNLIKFNQQEKGLFAKIDKKSAIIFFLNYIKSFNIANDKLCFMINQFIQNNDLTKEEKNKYIIRQVNNEGCNCLEYLNDTTVKVDKLLNKTGSHYENMCENIEKNQNTIEKKQQEDKILKIQSHENEENKKEQKTIIPSHELDISFFKESNNRKTETTINKLNKTRNNDILGIQAVKNNDILTIKEQLNDTAKKLDLTLKKILEKTEKKNQHHNSEIISQTSIQSISYNENKIHIKEQAIPYQEKLLIKEQQNGGNQIETDSNINKIGIVPDIHYNQIIIPINYDELTKQLLTLVKENNIQEQLEDLLNQLSELYYHFSKFEHKMEYICYLKELINNNRDFIVQLYPCLFSQLFEHILTILSFEILIKPNNENIIVIIQTIAENLKTTREIKEILILLLSLIRKYCPKKINQQLSDNTLVMLKILTYLIKELLEELKNEELKPYDIFSEINEIFNSTALDQLITINPPIHIYNHIYSLLKKITTEAYDLNKDCILDFQTNGSKTTVINETYRKYLNSLFTE